jgi:hypothetical protein
MNELHIIFIIDSSHVKIVMLILEIIIYMIKSHFGN